MKLNVFTALFLSLLISACQFEKLEIEVLSSQVLNDVPSASGMAKSSLGYYAIGDDSPYLFTLDNDFEVIKKETIFTIDSLDGNRIPKAIKPDFEAIEIIGGSELLIFGSGSKSPERDLLLIVNLMDSSLTKTYSLTDFYLQLKSLGEMQNNELNIEGVAYHNDRLYLLNRSNNLIYNFNYRAFKLYIAGQGQFPKPITSQFELPKIKGKQAGFSGATILMSGPYLLFTASVEDTDNAYDDGAVLGSFVGVIKLDGANVTNEFSTLLLPSESPLKVETITFAEALSSKSVRVVLATDSDGGESLLLNCKLNWDTLK